jgi:hypothetical protein
MTGIALALILAGAIVIRGALKDLSPVDAFRDIFDRATGGAGLPVGNIGGPPGPGFRPNPGGKFAPNVEQWRSLVAAHFPASIVDEALSVMACESQGNPGAVNPSSRASGLFQHLPEYWDQRSRHAGVPNKSIFDPNANVQTAAWLWRQTRDWSHWSCQPSTPKPSGVPAI